MNKNNSYTPEPLWAKLPHPMRFQEATSVATDSNDDVYVFNRGAYPLIIFDKKGNYKNHWGVGEFDRPHGIRIDKNDDLFLIDDIGHIVQKRKKNGEVIFTIGEKGKPAKWQGGDYFNRPTDVAIDNETGNIFVSDGYGNSRIHKFDSSGKHIKSWGKPGSENGEFSLPHNISIFDTNKIALCDRENFRVQIFDLDGNYLDQWHFHRPIAIYSDQYSKEIFVAEAGAPDVQEGVPNLGLRVVVVNENGEMLSSFGKGTLGEQPDQLIGPHGISVDSEGSVYIAEVSFTAYGSKQDLPREVVSLRKWIRS
ncbi:MAG: peptidylglycine alpha-amidating monooxygenase [Dehalococcoidales bacterium]|nr:peptidylglycine alpha-amidating monooxygenase [Dehalococcoidales bacterium]